MSDYDYLKLCVVCEDAYTLGLMCNSCAEQYMIDNDDADYPDRYEETLEELDDIEPQGGSQ